MRTYKKMSRVLALAILAVGLTGCANPVTSLTGNMENSVMGEGSGSGELVTKEKKSFETSEFDSIHINTQAMEVYVTQTTSNHAEVELRTDKAIENRFTFDASVQSRTLNLEVEEETKSFRATDGQKGERKLLISLPDKIYDQVTIQNQFGLVEAADLKTIKTDIKVDAGTIRLNRVSGEMLLETDAGKITVEGIRLENDLTAKTEVGEINIHLSESPKDAEVDLSSDVGKVTADLEQLQFSVNSTNEKVGAVGSKGSRLNAHASVGSISVDAQ